jgi:hypothetical protein
MTTVAKKEGTAAASGILVTHPIAFSVTKADIEKLTAKYKPLLDLDANVAEHYEEMRVAKGQLRTTRTGIDKRRKELTADALEYQRTANAAAAELTNIVSGLEDQIAAKMEAADEVKRLAKEAEEKAAVIALEKKLREEREAEEAKAKAEREAEEKRLAEEKAKHEAQRAEFAKVQKAADEKRAADQAALDAQQAAIDAERKKLDDEKAAAARAEQERLDREAAAKAAAEEAERLERLKPDIEKVRGWAPAFLALAENAPVVESPEAQEFLAWAVKRLVATAEHLKNFTPGGFA